jgi:general secretion pathway protein I
MSRTDRDAGFTLIETLVAFAILAIGLAVLMRFFGEVLDRDGKVEPQATAASLGQSLLARLGTDLPVRDGVTDGRFENGYRWRLTVTPYGDDGDRANWPVGAHQAVATMSWTAGGIEHSLSLTTLRLGPRPDSP